jgi:hypothetical protein
MQRLLLATIVVLTACSSRDTVDLTGSYRLKSQRVTSKDMDSTNHNPQIKIYTGGFGIYAQFGPDSAASWGVRKLLPAEGGVRESNVFGAVGAAEYPGPYIYTLKVEPTTDGYRQTVSDLQYRSQVLELTEEYERVDSDVQTRCDGAWELTKAFIINGQDTSFLDIVQYKFYHSGSFVFGHSLRDSAKVSTSGFGFGTFDMANDSTLTEHVDVSSYRQIEGKSFKIKVELVDKDNLFQVVDELEGAKSVESYRRLKKEK